MTNRNPSTRGSPRSRTNLENVDATRVCPSDPFAHRRLNVQESSYVINDYISSPGTDCIHNLNKLQATSHTIIVFEAANPKYSDVDNVEADATTFFDHAHATNWFRPLNIALGNVQDLIETDIQPDRHGDVAHYLYADGHVDVIPATQIYQWIDQNFDFAKPE